jgi:hypothetical protein
MKRLAMLAASILFVGSTGLVMAQDTAPATTPAPMGTPGMNNGMKGEHPRIHEVRERLKRQHMRIMAAVKAGKLTKDEGKALHEKVKSIGDEMRADIKSNGKTELTEDQFKQLNDELNTNSEAIKDGQSEGGSNTAPAGSTPSTGTSTNAPVGSSATPASNP